MPARVGLPLASTRASMRRTLALILALTVAAGLAAVAGGTLPRQRAEPAKTVSAATFVFSGRGYGHGAGMSQYGAMGQAKDAKTYVEILRFYYPGTEIGPAGLATIRVLLVENVATSTLSSTVAFRVRDVFGKTVSVPAGDAFLSSSFELTAVGEPPVQLTGPVSVLASSGAPLSLAGKRYRGRIDVSLSSTKQLLVVNTLGLEAYLQGVVPQEMPSDWPEEALKAQAVAARSYALASRKPGGAFDVYGDVRSQVYGGIAAESPSTNAAVQATKGEVLRYDGQIATTFFSSSSGGRTADATEVLSQPLPYIVSTPDPYDKVSPWHTWGPVTVGAAKLAKGLGVKGGVADLRLGLRRNGRVRSVVVTGGAGERTVSGAAVRSAAGLRSTWVTSVGVLSLSRPLQPLVHGSVLKLAGVARNVKAPTLETRFGAVWVPGPAVKVAPDGTFTVKLRPTLTGTVRLSAGTIVGPALRVPVAPRVTLVTTPTGVSGKVAPFEEGAEARLEQQQGSKWVPVGTATVAADGTFAFDAALEPGAYRASVAPPTGLVRGTSPFLQVGG